MNYILQEAMESASVFEPKTAVKEFKELLNLCKLNKFKSPANYNKFYDGFFMVSLQEELDYEQLSSIYVMLMDDHVFVNNLCMYIMMWTKRSTAGMFYPIVTAAELQLETMKSNRVRFLSDVAAFFSMMGRKFDSISRTVTPQTNDPDVTLFLTTIRQVLTNYEMYFSNKINQEIQEQSKDSGDIVITVRGGDYISETAQEIIDLFEHAEEFFNRYGTSLSDDELNEAIINKAKEAAKLALAKKKKAERAFEELIMKKVKELRRNRQNRRHAEIVGEALKIHRVLLRIFKSLGLGLINPALGVTYYVIDLVADKKTEHKDRVVLIRQVENEMEILEEKLNQADRNGDDKAKIQLMRARQQLQRRYELIAKRKYDPSRYR